MFLELDCTQVEVNPFAETPQGESILLIIFFFLSLFDDFFFLLIDHLVYAADAKMNFDDNAKFRQKEVFDMHNPEEDDPRELEVFTITHFEHLL